MGATHHASTLSAVEDTYPAAPSPRRLRVLLADNSPDFQTIVAALLEIEESVEIVGRVGSANEIIEASASLAPDLLLIDLGPVDVGLATAALVSWRFPRLSIVLTGDYDSPRLRAKARASGAHFFIYKPNFNLEFWQVLHTAASLPNSYHAAEKAEWWSAIIYGNVDPKPALTGSAQCQGRC